MTARRLLRLMALMTSCIAAPAAASAQAAPRFLEPGHWSYDAIRRLNVAGVAPPSSDYSLAPVTVRHALSVFASSDSAARARGRTGVAEMAAGYRALLLQETDTAGWLAAAEFRAGWTAARGEAVGGDGYFIIEDWEGAHPVGAASTPAALLRGSGYATARTAWMLDGGYAAGEAVIRTAVVSVAAGPFDLWAGRRRLQYGMGRGGGTVVGGALNDTPELAHRTGYTFQGIGAHVRDPFFFPAFLRFLGPDRIEASLGRLASNGRVDGPWVAFGRLIGSPFSPRFTIGINRGAIFGGDGVPITAGRLLGLVIGLHGGEGGEFENQVFSTLLSYRPPTDGWLPVMLYLEWGMDDTAGAVRNTPGIVAGLELAAIPALPALGVGVERTSFAQSCCGQPIWYRHIYYRGSWADEGRLFAHPLGGHGREWLATARLDLPQRGLLVRADAFTRDRYHENLFAPDRMGRSVGGSGGVQVGLASGTVLRLDAGVERGDGWDSARFSGLLSRSFAGWR
jgi:hypothetical protein